MQREREEWEEFLQRRKSRFLISHGLKMTTPCCPAGLPPLHPTTCKLKVAQPAADHIFSAWQPIYRPEQGTHFCPTWSGPHGFRGRVPPRRFGLRHPRGPSCSSSPRPWHLATQSPSRSRANTKAPPHAQASFPTQELTSEFNKLALSTPPGLPPPEAFVFPT